MVWRSVDWEGGAGDGEDRSSKTRKMDNKVMIRMGMITLITVALDIKTRRRQLPAMDLIS